MQETKPSFEHETQANLLRIEQMLDKETAQIHARKAERMCQMTAEYAMHGDELPDVREMHEHDFYSLYDAAAPTVAIDLCSGFRGSELTAQVAQMLRQQGKLVPNVVFVRGETNAARLVTTQDTAGCERSYVHIRHGIMVDAAGNVYHGRFPEPVVTSTLETTNPLLMQQCERLGITTLNSKEAMDTSERTEDTLDIAQKAGIAIPPRAADPEDALRWPRQTVVIKPSIASAGGIGVSYFDTTRDTAAMHDHYRLLENAGYQPLIEKFIPPRSLFDKDGTRLDGDWSVRYTVGGGDLVGVYIKINATGKPTNLAQGARLLSLQDFYEQYDHKQEMTEHIITVWERLAQAVSSSGIAGLDTIVGYDRSYLLENNIGQLGGMQNLTRLEPFENKVTPHAKLLEAWQREFCTASADTNGRTVHEERLARDMVALQKGVEDCGMPDGLASLTELELERMKPTHFGNWLWIMARLRRHAVNHEPQEVLDAIVDDAVNSTPVHFMSSLSTIVDRSADPMQFERHFQWLTLLNNTMPALKRSTDEFEELLRERLDMPEPYKVTHSDEYIEQVVNHVKARPWMLKDTRA